MDLLADKQTVMNYLNAHQGWFRRCAKPFPADPIGETGYALGVGRVGAFGFYLDPRIGLELLPPEQDTYRIQTIPIPDQPPQPYVVDFNASMRLQESNLPPEFGGGIMTYIDWDLDLVVSLEFPSFIQKLSGDLIKKTGDAVLAFVVKRVSTYLTAKVQADFHQTHNITIPPKFQFRRS